MKVTIYARVSSEAQASDDSVSINEQLSAQRALCERRGWQIVAEFVDSQNYIASQPPYRGKLVNPSGERADRPQFLEMLELLKSGGIDAVVCWRDDRLIRHPRVNVALIDALDEGDRNRGHADKVQIIDASGSVLDRFTMSIKAAVWQEENKRRVERARVRQDWNNQNGALGPLDIIAWAIKQSKRLDSVDTESRWLMTMKCNG